MPHFSTEMKTNIHQVSMGRLRNFLEEAGEAKYRLNQILKAVHVEGHGTWEEISTLPRALRERLDAEFDLTPPCVIKTHASQIDNSEKSLWQLCDGECVESVVLRHKGRVTLCLSSQAGCRMECDFCATGRGGLKRSLGPGEMVAQYRLSNERELERDQGGRIDRLVFMGMGEPLDNLDHLLEALWILTEEPLFGLGRQRITVSTAGLVPAIHRLAAEGPRVRLAISIGSAQSDVRSRLMPINKRYPLDKVIAAGVAYESKTKARVTGEYVLLGGVNDTDRDAAALVRLLAPTPIGLNVIEYNPVPGDEYKASDRTKEFVARLEGKISRVTVRRSLGTDISAACGQLAGED